MNIKVLEKTGAVSELCLKDLNDLEEAYETKAGMTASEATEAKLETKFHLLEDQRGV